MTRTTPSHATGQGPDPSELASFADQGFCVVRNAIDGEELDALRREYDAVVALSTSMAPPSKDDFKYRPILHENLPGSTSPLSRIEYSYDKSPLFFALLGHPWVTLIAAELLAGPGLNTWEDMVIKAPGCQPIGMHQDNLDIEQSDGTVFDIAVYFDDSGHDPLIVYPGTQNLGNLSLEACEEIATRRASEAVEVPVHAGDLLMHNVRAIHGSRANSSDRTRRVLYFEFRTIDQVRHSSPWSERWLNERLPYVLSAMQYRARLGKQYTDAEERLRDVADLRWQALLPGVEPLPLDSLNLRVSHGDFN